MGLEPLYVPRRIFVGGMPFDFEVSFGKLKHLIHSLEYLCRFPVNVSLAVQ